ncbi:MAG TPA: hypothetical protein VNU26_18300 [Mycobacteriales bacterium]|nr:hypothetical protein [Mycobacteriales bacterium]
MSRKHRTGQSGKGRPTPRQAGTGTRSRPTPTRTTGSKVKGPVYRQRKNPPLPVAVKVLLAAVWLGALAATIYLVEPWPGRIGVMIGVTFALVVVTVLALDPSRRRR